VNLEEIARIAGVSRSTVSRVVNGDKRVSDDARARVNEIITEYGYQPHAAARSLASRRTRMLGIRIPGEVSFIFSDPHFPEMLQGVVDACNEADYGLMLMMEPENDPISAERIYQRVIRGRHIDGVILSTSVIGDPFAGRVAADGIPAVMIGRHPTLPTVDIDNADAARQAVAHLIDHGYRQIAHIPGPCTIAAANERKAGYEAALTEAGIPVDASLIEPGDFTELSGYLAMRQLLERPEGRPDAVFGGSDTMAVGALRAITEVGLSIPDDVAVMGFDALAIHTRNYPYLSTLSQSIPNLGRTAVELLLRRISDPDSPAEHVYLSTELRLRGSCGCGTPASTVDRGLERVVTSAQSALTNVVKEAPAVPACA
jgi:LacI family transcriptional regulator, galactose operon repressor